MRKEKSQEKENERSEEKENTHSLLIRAGYLRQSQPGIFQLLPLGLRVQEKIERLIDRHMRGLGASKLSLSCISSQELWKQSDRLGAAAQDLFTFRDRRGTDLLLSPTHEEEITSLVSGIVKSYKDLPLRLYQISRKYRDEARPRAGLLRGREFLMKDLYTFDIDGSSAQNTYELVCRAYKTFFEDLKIPFLVAAADSGNMGGKISHEYHLPSPDGEDTLISCRNCGFVENEEFVEDKQYSFTHVGENNLNRTRPSAFREYIKRSGDREGEDKDIAVWRGITKDRSGLVEAFYLGPLEYSGKRRQINPHALKAVLPEVDLSVEDPCKVLIDATQNGKLSDQDDDDQVIKPGRIYYLFDRRLSQAIINSIIAKRSSIGAKLGLNCISITVKGTYSPLNLEQKRYGDRCPSCHEATLELPKAIELGHTFLLGTRYSATFNATATIAPESREDGKMNRIPLQMGCHGIGISRIIAAVASHLSDTKGLNWPRAIAPFECVIIPGRDYEEDATQAYDAIRQSNEDQDHFPGDIDAIIDDRDKSFIWKLFDSELIGVPIRVIVGKAWKESKRLEVYCRSLQRQECVSLENLRPTVSSLLDQL